MHHAPKPAGGQPANLPAETSATINTTAEAARLRKTIALADEAIRCAADHRSERHADGETIEETTARWNEAGEIEAEAKACRKAARAALTRVNGVVACAPLARISDYIGEARDSALSLKATIDRCQIANANRQIRVMARQIAAAVAADRQKGEAR
jgi:hypothetical protein